MSIVRQADIFSYSVTVTVTAGGFFVNFVKKLQNDESKIIIITIIRDV